MKLKTGTKISLLFFIFTFVISLFLLLFINIYTFFSWYNSEKKEVTDKIDKEYSEVLEDKNNILDQKNELISELKDKGGFIGINKKYNKIFSDIYSSGTTLYIIVSKNTQFGKINLPYDISLYMKYQINLLYISIIGLLFFSILSFFISKILFIKYALKDVFDITNKLKNIDFENIKNINIDLDEKDEIYEIIHSINKFITKIEKNTKNLQEFNSSVSHEFKTPLMIISSQIEYALKSKKYEDSFVKIEKQIDVLNELLETFLFISKIQNSKVSLKLKEINISNIVYEILAEYENIYTSKNIQIVKNISNDVFIKTDEKMFSMVIKNLADNSFKYTNNSGKIEIYLDNKCFKIKDNGVGISQDKIENIFENFYREKDDERGYGIGLNVVKKIIDILKFKISIKTQKGIGSEFEIKFNN